MYLSSFLFLFAIISFSILALGEEVRIDIQRVSSSPKIDGFLEESFWGDLTPLKDFVQFDPYNGKPPSEETFVYLAYDEDNLYVAFNCLDSQPEKIKGDLTPREKYGLRTNDDVRVILDTYYDKRNEYDFFVNPKGVQFDLPGDYVWKSGAKVNEDGWSAELEIPFKSIRFPKASPRPCGVNFARYIFRLKEKSYLTHVGRNDVKLEKSALLYGLRGIKGGKSIEFFPYSGYRNSVSGDEKDSKFAVGLDAKYSITSNLNLEVTASPDFAEVESDPFFYQLTPYEVRIGEKRPFFQEAGKYFVQQLFYTKRITNPKFAFKLTGKERGYTFGLLGALNKAEDTNENLGVCNIKKDIFSLSSISVGYSGYKTPDFTNHNAEMELNLRFSKKTFIYFDYIFTFNSDMEKQENGHYLIHFDHTPDEGFCFGSKLERIEKNYRPRAGFFGWFTDFQYWRIVPGYAKRINKFGIKTIAFDMDYRSSYDISGNSLGYTFAPFRIWINSLKEHYVRVSYRMGKQRVQIYGEEDQLEWTENFFQENSVVTSFGYKGSRFYSFAISLSYNLGAVYNSEYTEAYDGKSIKLSNSFELKPTSFLNFTLSLSYNKQNIRATGEELFEGILTSANIRYQISRQIYITSYIQHDSHYKRLNLDILLGIELGMANLIYLSFKRFYPLEGSPFEDKARSFVVKASYLIRI
jgi:opacity protein-like surface antigen